MMVRRGSFAVCWRYISKGVFNVSPGTFRGVLTQKREVTKTQRKPDLLATDWHGFSRMKADNLRGLGIFAQYLLITEVIS